MYAQNTISFRKVFSRSEKNNTSQPARNPVSLPLGIDTREVPLAGSPGSYVYNKGIQAGVREKITSDNSDATRYLEKAVNEDPDNFERIRKLLAAGASAFVSYEMIDKKQYEIMDLMHKSNPRLIRFSQMLHYACANCKDTAMIDFLIERGASLDLCGNYLEKDHDPYRGETYFQLCQWNSDSKLYYTPQDVAYRYNNENIVAYIIRKYKKYPTMLGMADRFVYFLTQMEGNSLFDWLITTLSGNNSDFNNLICQGKTNFENAMAEMLNTEIVRIQGSSVGYHDMLTSAIERLAKYRKTGNKEYAEKYEQIVRLMIEKGAKVDYTEKKSSLRVPGINIDNAVYYNTPLLAAMKEPNMLDIIKLLKAKGAPMKIKVSQHGRTYEIPIKDGPIRDEYKEAILLGEL